jgi:hypothetical protein
VEVLKVGLRDMDAAKMPHDGSPCPQRCDSWLAWKRGGTSAKRLIQRPARWMSQPIEAVTDCVPPFAGRKELLFCEFFAHLLSWWIVL